MSVDNHSFYVHERRIDPSLRDAEDCLRLEKAIAKRERKQERRLALQKRSHT